MTRLHVLSQIHHIIASYVCLIVLCGSLLCPTALQARDNTLEPIDMSEENTFTLRYKIPLLKLLYTPFNQTFGARFTVMPSFTPEYAWNMEKNENNEYSIMVVQLEENYWYKRNKNTHTKRIRITKEMYDAIAYLFQLVNRQANYEESDTLICDGIRYFFSIQGSDGKTQTAFTHSPTAQSRMARLAQICEAITELAPHTSEQQLLKLTEQVKMLTNELEQ